MNWTAHAQFDDDYHHSLESALVSGAAVAKVADACLHMCATRPGSNGAFVPPPTLHAQLYVAPEVARHRRPNQASDMYSFGRASCGSSCIAAPQT